MRSIFILVIAWHSLVLGENWTHSSNQTTLKTSSSHSESSVLSRAKRQFLGGGSCCMPFQMNPLCCPLPLPLPVPMPMPIPMPLPIPIPQPMPIGGACCSCCMPLCLPTCIPRCGLGLGLGGLGLGTGLGFGGCSPFGIGFRNRRKTKL